MKEKQRADYEGEYSSEEVYAALGIYELLDLKTQDHAKQYTLFNLSYYLI